MPWQHCGETLRDDEDECPHCGTQKARWTMRLDRTRKFVIGYPTLTLALVDTAGAPVPGEPWRVTLSSGWTEEGVLGPDGSAKVKLSARNTDQLEVSFPGRPASKVGPRAPLKGTPATSVATGDDPSRFECVAEGSYVFELLGVLSEVTASWEPDSLVATISAEWEPESLAPVVEPAPFEGESLAPVVEPAPFEGESLEPVVEPAPFEGESLESEVESSFEGESIDSSVESAWVPERLSA